jgi:hypothetical protein
MQFLSAEWAGIETGWDDVSYEQGHSLAFHRHFRVHDPADAVPK